MSTAYADATINCGDRTWRVHKIIVCGRSTYFKDVFDDPSSEVGIS